MGQGCLNLTDFPYILWYFSTHGTKILYHQSGIGPPLSIIVHMGTIILLPKNIHHHGTKEALGPVL